MDFFKIFLILTVQTFSFARTNLLEFTAKQSVQNLRFLTSKDELTIYKKGFTSLSYATNYKAINIFEQKSNHEYLLNEIDKDKFLIWKIDLPHSYLSPAKDGEIYYFHVETQLVKKLGDGVSPKSFENGKYITFYNIRDQIIHIYKYPESLRVLSVKLNSKRPFYIPQVTIIGNQLFYTDINDKENEGLLRIDLRDKSRSIVKRSESSTTFYKTCIHQNKLLLVSSDYFQPITTIEQYEGENQLKSLMSANIGPSKNFICDFSGSIFFVSKIQGKTKKVSEVIEFRATDKKMIRRSDLKFVSSIVELDKQIIIPFRDKFYSLKNKEDKYVVSEVLND